MQLHPQLVVGEFEGSGNGLEVVDHHAAKHTNPTSLSLTLSFPLSLSISLPLSLIVALQQKQQCWQRHDRAGDVARHRAEPQREVIGHGLRNDVINLLLTTATEESGSQ